MINGKSSRLFFFHIEHNKTLSSSYFPLFFKRKKYAKVLKSTRRKIEDHLMLLFPVLVLTISWSCSNLGVLSGPMSSIS